MRRSAKPRPFNWPVSTTEKQIVETRCRSASRRAASEIGGTQKRRKSGSNSLRQQQFEIVGREARIRNEVISRREIATRISAQIERLEREEAEARSQTSTLEQQLTAARERIRPVSRRVLPAENPSAGSRRIVIRATKLDHADAVKAAAEAKTQEESIRHRLQTIGELAVQRAYSTESVQQFFNAIRGPDWAPLGILADFVEVETDYEALVEDFLRWKLQYVVVEDRDEARPRP